MDSMNAFDGQSVVDEASRLSVVESASNLTDEDFTRKPKVDETVSQIVSNEITANTPKRSGEKKFEQPAKAGKMSLKRKNPIKEELPGKRNKSNSVPISQMVMESIKSLRKRNGATKEAILEHMEGRYEVNAKLVKSHVSRFLTSAVQKDIVEQQIGAGDVPKYKIKKAEKITKTVKKLNANQKMVKAEKIAKISQKLNNQKMIKAKKTAKAEQKSKPKEDGPKVVKVAKVK